MPWWNDLRTSLTWRQRRDRWQARINGDGTIGLADTMPDLLTLNRDGGFPAYLPTQRAIGDGLSVTEHGISGTENLYGYIWNEEYNPKLAGQAAIGVYDQMRRSDAQVHASLDMVKLPLRSADVVIEAASDDPEDQRIADFCAAKLLDDDAMLDSFASVLRHVLLSEDFGTSAVEKVYKVDDNGDVALHRLAPRLPKTFERFDVDADGQLTQLVQYGPKQGHYDFWTIPSELIAVFPREKEGDNYWGMSTLRTAYKNWYYKNEIEHIDMIAHDKYGVGTPHAKLASGFPIGRAGELQRLENALLGVRSGQRNFLITSDKVTIDILVAANGGGRPVKDSLTYHNTMIARNVLANHLALGDAPHGTYELGVAFMDLFLYALQSRAADIAGAFKRDVLKPLCDLNFNMAGRDYPTMRFQNLTNFNVEKLGAAFAPLVTAGVITVTDDVEDMFRQLFDLPPLPDALRRDTGRPLPGVNISAAIAGDVNEQAKVIAHFANTRIAQAPGAPAPPAPAPAPAPPAPPAPPRSIAANETIRLTDEMVAAIREEFAEQRKAGNPDREYPPLNIHIVMPTGRVVRTNTRNVFRDERGLVVKIEDQETEGPHAQ